MVAHASLTGADLHEVKGADSATAGQVYMADGAGSASFQENRSAFLGVTAYDTTTQSPAGTSTVTPVTFSTELVKNVATFTPGGSVTTINRDGKFRLSATLNIRTASGGAGQVEVGWEANTGSGFAIIPGSIVTFPIGADTFDTVVSEVVDDWPSGTQFRLVWGSDSTSITIQGWTSTLGWTIPSGQMSIVNLGV